MSNRLRPFAIGILSPLIGALFLTVSCGHGSTGTQPLGINKRTERPNTAPHLFY